MFGWAHYIMLAGHITSWSMFLYILRDKCLAGHITSCWLGTLHHDPCLCTYLGISVWLGTNPYSASSAFPLFSSFLLLFKAPFLPFFNMILCKIIVVLLISYFVFCFISFCLVTFHLVWSLSSYIFGSSTTWNRSTTHPKFNPTGVWTHDLQIMTVHFMSLRRLL